MTDQDKIARAICAEQCAFIGEPPCHTLPGPWPNPECNEPGCHALAQAVVEAMKRKAGVPSDRAAIMAARTPRGGWTKAQLAEWGVSWPPQKGWIDELITRQARLA